MFMVKMFYATCIANKVKTPCQVYVEECKYADAEGQQWRILSDLDDSDGYFEVLKETWTGV